MRLRHRIPLLAIASLALALQYLLAAVWLGANTGPGQRLIETAATRLTGGTVRLEGLSGSLPWSISLHRLTLADAAGPWLTIEQLALDWSPLRLLSGDADVERLEAEHVALTRLPAASSGESGASTPMPRVVLRRLRIERLDLGPEIAGHPVTLSAEGSGAALSPTSGNLRLALATPDQADHYTVDASVQSERLRATIAVTESAGGFLAGLAGLPDLGAVRADASLDGPWDNVTATLALTAGPLRADAAGSVNTTGRTADLTVSAAAPAMTPGPGVSWSSIRLDARLRGAFLSPDATGTLTIANLTAAGAGFESLRAELAGTAGGPMRIQATIAAPRIPGPQPVLLAGAPIVIDATVTPDAPARFTLRHTLITAEGTVATDATFATAVTVTLPDLTPFAALGGVDLSGHTALDVRASRRDGVIELAAKGGIGITGGLAPVPALIGDAGSIDLAATLRGETIDVTRLAITGNALEATARGEFVNNQATADWTARLTRLEALRPTLSGTADANGHVAYATGSITSTTDIGADVAASGYQSGHVTAHAEVSGPLDAPNAKVTVEGTVLDAPLSLAVAAVRRDGGLHFTIDRGAWKSLQASGTLDLASGATVPTGDVQVAMRQLGDLAPLLGQKLSGEVSASLTATDGTARVNATVKNLELPGVLAVAGAALRADVADPLGQPGIDAVLSVDGFASSQARGSARITGKGKLDALMVGVTTTLPALMGTPARAEANGTVNCQNETLALTALTGNWRGETIRLLSPANFAVAGVGATVDRLRLGLRGGELELSGRAGETLDAKVRLTNLPADLAASIASEYAADGTISGDAALTGPTARPNGTIQLRVTGVRMRGGPGRALPPANATARAALHDGAARLDASIIAGTSSITLTGQAPLNATGRLDLKTAGSVDLAMLQPLLAGQGRTLRGKATLDVAIGGSMTAPRADGVVRVAGVDFADYQLGAHVSDVAGTLRLAGETIQVAQLSGRAGTGTISASGSAELSGARRMSLAVQARNARLLGSDLATATGDASVTVSGVVGGAMSVDGTISVHRADVSVPERLPAGVKTIPVRIAGKRVKPPPPVPPPPDVTLNVTLDAPEQIYIRGRGLDVELGGKVGFAGTAALLRPNGALRLRRGTVSLAGVSLALTDGTIDFTGASLTDPQLRLVASYSSSAMVSTLTVSGPVRDPKIVLSSTPEVPQDEILAQILFNTTKSQLTPFQVAEIAAALASLSGVSSGFGDPLASLRDKLGLDQLSVGSTAGSSSPSLQAGRYLMPGVRLGVQQSATGGETQGTIDVDLTKHLKLQTTAGRGTSSATAGGNAASVGIKYQMEY